LETQTLVEKPHSSKKQLLFQKEGKDLKRFELSPQLGLKIFIRSSILRGGKNEKST